ncbi:radical SAM family heme chaperone HemW [Scopulibacillus darangshiensis]|uniref:radical SAM family heme chaperone HemW n=1 Tax=Scopulibacillus darangshiensis TaxID=442528 RepID=UPI0010479DA5|nr:radical SAM family heme chaperone HemW [Scopulibacillus darangshiensis]
MKGAYVHIPFCEHICYYCDFNKVFIQKQPVDDYLNALEKEITNQPRSCEIETIFIGGGTPTALNTEQFEKLMVMIKDHLYHNGITEYTVEANPENLDNAKLRLMKNYGVTRLSLGVQTFQNDLLTEIGRPHTNRDVIHVMQEARHYGFDNISIDLMFGLPNQTEDMLRASINEALRLDPEHISIYSLQIEPKTIFYNRMKKGKLVLPGQDIEAQMYELIINELAANGLIHYEISNFAKKGHESRHNLHYWNNDEYFGFGAGAHGYINDKRVVNAGPIKSYIREVNKKGHARTATHEVTRTEKIEEEMFLGLRKLSGVSKRAFYTKYHQTIDDIYSRELADLKERGLLTEDEKRVALTKQGVFLGNTVFESFIK